MLSKQLTSKRDQNEFLCRIKAASESGWGLSSKHFHNRNHYDELGSKNNKYLLFNYYNF